MKHFIIEIIYTVEIDKIKEVVGEHREYLQIGYDNEMLLCSGPKEPLTGGILIAKAEDKVQIEDFIKNDPYNKAGLADYKITEFNPVKRQSFLENWI